MSTQRNQVDPHVAAGALVFFTLAGLALMFVAWVATLIGASFTSVLKAFGWWLFWAAAIGLLAVYVLRGLYWTCAALFACLAWMGTWGVLDSIAAGGREGDSGPIDFSQYSSTIINSGWVEWGVLFVLFAALVYAFYRERGGW